MLDSFCDISFLGKFLYNISKAELFTGAQAAININSKHMNNLKNGLYIVCTPIGNLEDLSLRAKNVLSMVDIIVCENPKHSLKLLNNLGIKKKLFSLHDYNEKILIERIAKYQQNSSVALISDAGAPLISDPGYNLVIDYINKNIMVTPIPGPTSIISALQVSGLPIHSFKFFGFVPKNKSSLKDLINQIFILETTGIFFISGVRLIEFLNALQEKEFFRNLSVCKELTKLNERIFRGKTNKIIEELYKDKKNLKGEFVIVIEGLEKKNTVIIDLSIKKMIKKLLNKFSLTEVVQIVHKLTHISKKEIYQTALLIKND